VVSLTRPHQWSRDHRDHQDTCGPSYGLVRSRSVCRCGCERPRGSIVRAQRSPRDPAPTPSPHQYPHPDAESGDAAAGLGGGGGWGDQGLPSPITLRNPPLPPSHHHLACPLFGFGWGAIAVTAVTARPWPGRCHARHWSIVGSASSGSARTRGSPVVVFHWLFSVGGSAARIGDS
jgi:hypothetical protein